MIYSLTQQTPTTHLKVPHDPARLDRAHRPEQREQLPIGHVLRQIVDDQIRAAAAADAIVRGARPARMGAGQTDAAQRRCAGRGQVMVRMMVLRVVLLVLVLADGAQRVAGHRIEQAPRAVQTEVGVLRGGRWRWRLLAVVVRGRQVMEMVVRRMRIMAVAVVVVVVVELVVRRMV